MQILEILFLFFEFIAALFGIVYIRRYRVDNSIRYFVYFLWINFAVELFGELPKIIDQYDQLQFLKSTFLEENAWLYNIYTIISYWFYISFFKWNVKTKKFTFILNILMYLFLLVSITNLIVTDVFFKIHSALPMIPGTLIVVISVFFYFFEMLKSEKVLEFNKDLIFYIAIGALVFYLCAPPLFIYSGYYSNQISTEFVKIRQIILYSTIIFMYTCYTLGFIICIFHRKLYPKNKSY